MNAFVGGLLVILIPPCTAQKNSRLGSKHGKGDTSDIHYQRVSVEYNLLVSGKLISNGKQYVAGEFFCFLPYEVCEVEFLEDCSIVVVKVPSLPDDKVAVQCM